MHTACLFPGLNAIARDRDRSRYLGLPEVARRVASLRRWGHDRWLHRPAGELYRSGDFTALAALTLAIQTGTYEHLCRRGLRADILLGCSLGDVARTVCSGAIAFDDAIELVAQFQQHIGKVTAGGSTRSVRLPPGQKLDAALLAQLREHGLEPSILSNRHFIVGCDAAGAAALARLSRPAGWQVKTAPFPYALHSRHLRSAIDALVTRLDPAFRAPRVPVFSTVQLKVLDSAAELYEDARRCFCTPVQWVQSLARLSAAFGVRRFINIGPCHSLSLLLRETSLEITIDNADSLIQQPQRRRAHEIRNARQYHYDHRPVAVAGAACHQPGRPGRGGGGPGGNHV